MFSPVMRFYASCLILAYDYYNNYYYNYYYYYEWRLVLPWRSLFPTCARLPLGTFRIIIIFSISTEHNPRVNVWNPSVIKLWVLTCNSAAVRYCRSQNTFNELLLSTCERELKTNTIDAIYIENIKRAISLLTILGSNFQSLDIYFYPVVTRTDNRSVNGLYLMNNCIEQQSLRAYGFQECFCIWPVLLTQITDHESPNLI